MSPFADSLPLVFDFVLVLLPPPAEIFAFALEVGRFALRSASTRSCAKCLSECSALSFCKASATKFSEEVVGEDGGTASEGTDRVCLQRGQSNEARGATAPGPEGFCRLRGGVVFPAWFEDVDGSASPPFNDPSSVSNIIVAFRLPFSPLPLDCSFRCSPAIDVGRLDLMRISVERVVPAPAAPKNPSIPF